MSEEPTLVQLAERMLEYARAIESAIPSPTFQNDTITQLPNELASIRLEAIATSERFNDLVRGSRGSEARWWKNIGPTPACNMMAWSFIYRFQVAQNVPLDRPIAIPDLAAKCGVDPEHLTSVLRYASATLRCFHEPAAGLVAHTAESRLLLSHPAMMDVIGYCTQQLVPAGSSYAEAVARWPGSQALHHSAYCAHFDTDHIFFHHMAGVPDWQRRFSSAMTEFSLGDAEATGAAALAYPWADLAHGAARVVDLGGGTGHIAFLLAAHHPDMSFVVQDLPRLIATLPPSPNPRVAFQAHDYFTPQTVVGADAYFFGMVLHNQPDPDVLRTLRALIPALKPGARVLWCDRDVDPAVEGAAVEGAAGKGGGQGEGKGVGKTVRVGAEQRRTGTLALDLIMKMLMNAKERTLAEKQDLFAQADARFRFARNVRAGDSPFGVAEAVWTP